MDRDPFWIVWCVDGGTPTVRHLSLDAAAREAERLARQHPGREFAVCVPIKGFQKVDVERFNYSSAYDPFGDGVPF